MVALSASSFLLARGLRDLRRYRSYWECKKLDAKEKRALWFTWIMVAD